MFLGFQISSDWIHFFFLIFWKENVSITGMLSISEVEEPSGGLALHPLMLKEW